MKNKYSWLKHFDFFVLDVICLLFSIIVGYYLRHRNLWLFDNKLYQIIGVVYVLSDLLLYLTTNPYRDVLKIGKFNELKKTVIHCTLVTILAITFLFFNQSGDRYSRITMLLTMVLYIISSYVVRILWKNRIKKKAAHTIKEGNKSLLIICKHKEAEEIVDRIKKNNFEYYRISGLCVIDKEMTGETIADCKIVAGKKSLIDYISSNWIDDIFISSYSSLPQEAAKQLSLSGIPIHVKIDRVEGMEERVQKVEKFSSYNTIGIIRREYNEFELLIKRLMDIAGSLVGCAVTLILIITIGPIIYIKSPGNIFYVSDRVGKNGKIFKFYKFRSMILNADDLKEDLKKKNRVKDGMMFKIENDPRIIPGIGNFIRKTSLDEFPQFFNVLKGDMSLVGTRPPTIDEWNKYSPYYRSRLTIKPGITGLWQISGRSQITDFEEVVRLDNEYINNWSLGLDIKILIKTVLVLFSGDKGAM